jgi:hypothetical protein
MLSHFERKEKLARNLHEKEDYFAQFNIKTVPWG